MIKNKKYIYFALFPFITSIALNFRFPDTNPYGEEVVSILNIPVQTVNGINYLGMASLFSLILSLYLLVKSLEKYHVRFVIITILVAIFTPPIAASAFQKTLASGIYAISYQSVQSKCSFERITETTLHGVCELPFENYSKNDVQFSIEFYKQYPNEDQIQMVSLMNNNPPYKVHLKGKESRLVKIESNINVSKTKNRIDGEEVNDIKIIIKSGQRMRKL